MVTSKAQRKEKASLTSSLNSAGNLLRGLGHVTSLSWSSKIEGSMGKGQFCGFPCCRFPNLLCNHHLCHRAGGKRRYMGEGGRLIPKMWFWGFGEGTVALNLDK